jgi:hypothetical protein
MRVSALTQRLLEDRKSHLAERTPSSIDCFGCGRSFTYRGPKGDDSGRFCGATCRNAYDNGFRRQHVDVFSISPLDWKVRTGPLEVEVGAQYYAPRNSRKSERLANDDLIRPRRQCVKCGQNLPVWIKGKKARKNQKFCQTCRG